MGEHRVGQALRAACMLMWRSGRDRSRHADLTVDLGDPAVTMTDFAEAPGIIDRARERLLPWIPEIHAAWSALAAAEVAPKAALPDNVIPLLKAA